MEARTWSPAKSAVFKSYRSEATFRRRKNFRFSMCKRLLRFIVETFLAPLAIGQFWSYFAFWQERWWVFGDYRANSRKNEINQKRVLIFHISFCLEICLRFCRLSVLRDFRSIFWSLWSTAGQVGRSKLEFANWKHLVRGHLKASNGQSLVESLLDSAG